jgi:general nucleoside transport system ATP-binding protein
MTWAEKLETRNLSKKFGSFVAVDGVSLDFEPGKIHAVLGENGAGKTTMMKLLFGLHQPSSGAILLDGKAVKWSSTMDAIDHGLGMVQQHFTLVDTLSAIDNIMLGAEVCSIGKNFSGSLDRKKAIALIEGLLPSQHLAVPWNTQVGELTVGQKQRVEILKLLFRKSKILFLDEPTAVLTPAEIDELFEVLRELKKQGRTIVLITHKLNEVLHICDTYSVLRAGKLVARGEVAGATVDKIVESMIGRKLPEFTVERPAAQSATVLSCQNLTEPTQERGRLDGISLRVQAGEIVGVAGVEGSGQSHFVEAILGLRSVEGKLEILGQSAKVDQTRSIRKLGLGLVPEDRHRQGLWLEESCYINMMIGLEEQFIHGGVFDFSRLEEVSGDWAKGFDVRAASLSVPVGSLSGGNQQKVIFAREVTGRRPRLLVCHQPTRGVDLGAIDLIHRKLVELRNEGLGVLVLSSELDELLKLCDRIVVFFEGKVSQEFSRGEFDRLKIGAAMTGVRNAL